ncbi:MAG: hypothetical protein LBQ12_08300 [Deltaproteobacteria bacterium]|nr:hypothetical protein [Deltaproteobacteria bacterium]
MAAAALAALAGLCLLPWPVGLPGLPEPFAPGIRPSGPTPHPPALAAVAPAPGDQSELPQTVDQGYERLERHLRKTVKNKGIQTDLPLYEPHAPPKKMEIPKPPVSLAKAAAALAVGGCVALAFILVSRALRSRKPQKEEPPQPETAKAASRRELDNALKHVRDDADDLAGKGLFGEAVHALLLNGLEAFRKRDRLKVPPHMTSRELLPALPLNRAEDESLRELVFMSEYSWFGAFVPGEEHYKAARASFGRLISSVTPAAAAAAADRGKARAMAESARAAKPAGVSGPVPATGPSPLTRPPSSSAALAAAAPGPAASPGAPASPPAVREDSR